jgi:hypothetical protein
MEYVSYEQIKTTTKDILLLKLQDELSQGVNSFFDDFVSENKLVKLNFKGGRFDWNDSPTFYDSVSNNIYVFYKSWYGYSDSHWDTIKKKNDTSSVRDDLPNKNDDLFSLDGDVLGEKSPENDKLYFEMTDAKTRALTTLRNEYTNKIKNVLAKIVSDNELIDVTAHCQGHQNLFECQNNLIFYNETVCEIYMLVDYMTWSPTQDLNIWEIVFKLSDKMKHGLCEDTFEVKEPVGIVCPW